MRPPHFQRRLSHHTFRYFNSAEEKDRWLNALKTELSRREREADPQNRNRSAGAAAASASAKDHSALKATLPVNARKRIGRGNGQVRMAHVSILKPSRTASKKIIKDDEDMATMTTTFGKERKKSPQTTYACAFSQVGWPGKSKPQMGSSTGSAAEEPVDQVCKY